MSKVSKICYLLSGLSIIAFVVVRFLVGVWIPFLWIPIGLAVVLFFAPIYIDFRFFKEIFSMKTTKNGMSMGLTVLLVLITLSALNFIAARKYKTFDFSQAKFNSLSDQSVQLLKSVDTDLKVYFFYKKGQEQAENARRNFIELIRKYQDVTSHIKLEFVEVDERPALVKEFGVDKGSGVVFVEYKGVKNKIDEISEQELTRALINTMSTKQKTVYIVTGHAEGQISDTQSALGLAGLKSLLEGNRYTIKELNFATQPSVPADADMLFVIGPNQTYLDFEQKAMEDYLNKGGNLLLAVDPLTQHGLDKLVAKMGIEFTNNFVVNVIPTAMGQAVDPRATLATEYSQTHTITKVFKKDSRFIMRLPQAVKKISSVPNGVTVEELIKTAANSAAFDNPQFNKMIAQGPFALGMAIKGKLTESATKEFNAIVLGDSDILGNQLLYQSINRDLILNSISFLAKEENLISISPKEIEKSELSMTQNKFLGFIFGFIVPLPLLLMITSGVLWFKRRHA